MNLFNRIVMVLACLILLVLVGFVLIQPLDAIDMARSGLAIFEQTVMNEQLYSIFLGVTSLILILLLVVLILELRHPRYRTVRVKSKGNVQLDVSSVAQSLAYRVDELPGVRQVVRSSAGGAPCHQSRQRHRSSVRPRYQPVGERAGIDRSGYQDVPRHRRDATRAQSARQGKGEHPTRTLSRRGRSRKSTAEIGPVGGRACRINFGAEHRHKPAVIIRYGSTIPSRINCSSSQMIRSMRMGR